MALSANLIGALLKRADYDFIPTIYTPENVTIVFTSPKTKEKQTYTYTIEDAKKSGSYDKAGDMYKKYPTEMLYARCLGRGGRIVAGEVLFGVYAVEEFTDGELIKDTPNVSPIQTDIAVVDSKTSKDEEPKVNATKKTTLPSPTVKEVLKETKAVEKAKKSDKPESKENAKGLLSRMRKSNTIGKIEKDARDAELEMLYEVLGKLGKEATQKTEAFLLKEKKVDDLEDIPSEYIKNYRLALEKKHEKKLNQGKHLIEAIKEIKKAENESMIITKKLLVEQKYRGEDIHKLQEFKDAVDDVKADIKKKAKLVVEAES